MWVLVGLAIIANSQNCRAFPGCRRRPAYFELFMRFCLLDRICSYTPGVELKAVKNVSLAEEYLADHFPEFPVLPGVFMLEAATQAGAWLLRFSDDFAHSIITLAEARAVKYADFVSPGQTLRMTVRLAKRDGVRATLKFEGEVEGRASVSGRLILTGANLADENPELAGLDEGMRQKQRELAAVLCQGQPVPAPVAVT